MDYLSNTSQSQSTSNPTSITNEFFKYDLISVLNLLDRCDTPITLLKKIKNALKPNGILVVALVLPFKPYVEYNADNKPKECIFDESLVRDDTATQDEANACTNTLQPVIHNSEEANCSGAIRRKKKTNQQIDSLIERVFKPLGFALQRFSKLPYLCEGNLVQSYYFMTDYVFVFKSV